MGAGGMLAHCTSGLLPSEENYSDPRDLALRTYLADKLHYIPLGEQERRYLTLGGEGREWYEFYSHPHFGEGPDVPNGYLLQRYLGYSDLHLGSRLRFFGEYSRGRGDSYQRTVLDGIAPNRSQGGNRGRGEVSTNIGRDAKARME